MIKVEQNQGGVGYLAPDCKASLARIGAVSLPQSAWILQYEQACTCFAARCFGILQGRLSDTRGPYGCPQKLFVQLKYRLGSLRLAG
ncbi:MULTISPECIES: hypothetical protein [Olivibacter]|uniref:Uncharacterized protein n=1 Tax=Olivibacter oleidegradans TaxID=760123 RepID=A0ABV6HF17_9SPHI|nr:MULTISPECIES: hypothetical protein [Olivibacter]QEK99688.1 hypothetical protein FKG96_02370 [Olivibacter sp. LS-1]